MAQYYHILGQPQPMTIEDLQRINICVDGSNTFIINSDEAAYGPQQVILSSGDQTHGIIVGSAPDSEPGTYSVGPTQYIMQHDSSNITAQSTAPAAAAAPATHQQVYFTGEQVVLQQGQQIIDPSLVTHQPHQIQQHHQQLVQQTQQTIAHPSHSLLQLHSPGIMQQQQTLHYVDHRHQGQQIQQHQIQHQQLQQHQQQQIQQHQQQQQLQQLQQQQLQLMQQQQQQQIQQHFPRQQSPFQQQQTSVPQQVNQIQHPPPRVLNHHLANSPRPSRPAGPRGAVRPPRPQNRTPNATMRNPAPVRTPTRLVRPQLVNTTPSNETTPIRNRAPTPVQQNQTQIQTPNRINQQNRFNIQQTTTVPKRFILNTSAGAPSDLDDLEESITAAVLSKNPNSNQHQENVKQEQFTITTNIGGQQQQQVVRQQGVQQPQMQNNMIHINAQLQINNQPQQHIIQVQPQNFNHQQQAQPPQQQFNAQNQIYRQQQISLPQVNQPHQNVFSGEIFVEQQGHQQLPYDQQQQQQVFEGATQESDEMVALSNGQKISVTEFKKMQQNRSPRQLSPTRIIRSFVMPPPPVCNGQSDKPEIQNPQGAAGQGVSSAKPRADNQVILKSSDTAEPQSAKMLIMLPNGEQRLITFILPKESCTVQELLEQINVPVSADSEIQCIPNTAPELDYFVFIGSPAKLDEMLENTTLISNDMSNAIETGSPSSTAMNSTEVSPEKNNPTPAIPPPQAPPQPPPSPPPRFIDGMLAVCKYCGFTGLNFNKCQRCSRKFPEEPKAVPICTTKKPEKTEVKEPSGIGLETMKLNLLKPMKGKIIHDAKNKKNRRPRAKHLDPEPVILTLSSDDEDSNSSSQNNQGIGEPLKLNNIMDSSFLKEPSVKDLEVAPNLLNSNEDLNREEIIANNASNAAVIPCRTIRIGSYKFTPKESVLFTSKGVRILAPMIDDPTVEVDLQLQSQEIVRVLMQPGKGLPAIFLYTNQLAAQYVCMKLHMTDTNGLYYNPISHDEVYRRIALLPVAISEEMKTNMKLLFESRLEELTCKEANDILLKTCSKEAQQSVKMVTRTNSTVTTLNLKSTSTLNNETIRKILIYPPGKGGISINTEDYMCLAQDQFLNDVIIDFYLKYLCHETLSQHQRDKTHVFSTFFYKRLTTKPIKPNRIDSHEWDASLTPAQKRHLRVKSWTKNVNIFDKDFIIVPINENCHWFLAIICFPGLEGCRSMRDDRLMSPQEMKKKTHEKRILQLNSLGPMLKQEQLALNCDGDNLSEKDEAEAEESDMDLQGSESDEEEAKPVTIETNTIGKIEPIKQPCILIFDSLAGASRSRVVATLRDYLTHEYAAKMKGERIFTRDNIKGACPKIPQQSNYTDCGLYLLQFVEHFFKDPILDYRLPIKQLVNWFEEIVVTRKREEISNLLKKLMLNSNNDTNILPDIMFPTLHGKLLDVENGDGEIQSGDSALEQEVSSSEMESPRKTINIVTINNIVNQLNTSDNNDSACVRKTTRMDTVNIPIKFTDKPVHVQNNFSNKTFLNKRKMENVNMSSSYSASSDTGSDVLKKKRK